jgi:hypothetical protein
MTGWRAALLVAVVAEGALASSRPRLALAPLATRGDALGQEARAALVRSLEGALTAAGFQVVAPDGVARQVRAALELIGTNYQFTLEVVDGEAVAARRIERCEVCSLAQANEALAAAAAHLVAGLPAPPAPSPLPVAAAPAERPRSGAPFGRAAIATGVLGALGLVAGATLLAVDGAEHRRTIVTAGDGAGQIAVERWDTLGAGIACTVVGAALVASAGVLWWRAHALALVPALSGGAARLTLLGRY